MARNLNKISAVISVNSAEARQQLAGFAGDAKKYAKSLDSSFQSMTRGVQRSFDKIWTEQQRVQRALQAGSQAGVAPEVLRMFGDTKKLEQEANKIAELRKRAFDMKTFEGNAAATAEIDKIATAFTRLNDKLVRTGSISKKELAALQAGIASVATGVGVIGKQDDRLGTSRTIRDQFSSGKLSEFFESKQLSQSVRQLEAYRNILLQVGATAKGPIQTAFSNLVKVQAKAAKEGVSGQEKYKNQIEAARLALEKLISAEAKAQGGRSRNLRTVGGIRNQVDQASTGSVNSSWGTRSGLAIQQLTFAFDDFNSATGGVDAKIRAMGNNISQFGLIAGGTAGLIGGVLIGAMAQLYASYLKHADALNDSKNVTAALADEERKLAQARKNQADVIAGIGNALQEAGLTKSQKSELEASREAEAFQKSGEAEARAKVGISDPALRRMRSRQKQIEEILANPDTNLARRRRLTQEQAALEPQIARREVEMLGAASLDIGAQYSEFVKEVIRIANEGGQFFGMFDLVDDMNTVTALQGQVPDEVWEHMARNLMAGFAADAQENKAWWRDNPEGALTGGRLVAMGENVASDTQNTESREIWARAKQVGDAIPAMRKAEEQLSSLRQTLDSEFGSSGPMAIEEAMTRIRGELEEASKAMIDSKTAEAAETAAEEVRRLNDELASLTAEAKDAVEANQRRRRQEEQWKKDRQAAEAERRKAKEDFRSKDPRYAVERAMEEVKRYNSGAMANGLTGEERGEAVRDMMVREFAPAILQMANARENSLLKGASKSSIDMQDISTSGGAAEFARLISGDDSAKNQDLVELRKQTQLLGTLVQKAEDEGIL